MVSLSTSDETETFIEPAARLMIFLFSITLRKQVTFLKVPKIVISTGNSFQSSALTNGDILISWNLTLNLLAIISVESRSFGTTSFKGIESVCNFFLKASCSSICLLYFSISLSRPFSFSASCWSFSRSAFN